MGCRSNHSGRGSAAARCRPTDHAPCLGVLAACPRWQHPAPAILGRHWTDGQPDRRPAPLSREGAGHFGRHPGRPRFRICPGHLCGHRGQRLRLHRPHRSGKDPGAGTAAGSDDLPAPLRRTVSAGSEPGALCTRSNRTDSHTSSRARQHPRSPPACRSRRPPPAHAGGRISMYPAIGTERRICHRVQRQDLWGSAHPQPSPEAHHDCYGQVLCPLF